MLWNCPHCQCSLSVQEEKIGTTWAFSQCCDCRGFSMIRKPEVNVIKVNRAPEGERVVPTDPGDSPLLGREANQKLAKYIQTGGKPEVRPAPPRRAMATQSSPPRLPEIPAALRKKEAAPTSPSPAELAAEAPPPDDSEAVSSIFGYPEAHPETPALIYARPKMLPIAMGVAGAMAIGSGIYLYLQSQAIWEKAQLTSPASGRSSVKLSDQRKPANESDQIPTSAAAPQYFPPATQSAPQVRPAPSAIRTRQNNVRLRSGPGNGYPIVAIVDENAQFAISDWSEHWFKVVLPEPKEHALSDSSLPKTAWVQADAVQVLNSIGQ